MKNLIKSTTAALGLIILVSLVAVVREKEWPK
jgi:hypothetical protein